MNTASLRLIRNILLRTTVVSYLLVLLIAATTVGMWDTWSSITCTWYHVTPDSFATAILNFFVLIKFYYLFVLLAPALAIHWTIKTQEKNS